MQNGHKNMRNHHKETQYSHKEVEKDHKDTQKRLQKIAGHGQVWGNFYKSIYGYLLSHNLSMAVSCLLEKAAVI